MAHDPYLYVAPGADKPLLEKALHSIDPDLSFDVDIDEFAGDPLFRGFPTIITYYADRDAAELAARMRELVPWQVVSLAELETLAAH